jgi:hypothetical protein
MLILTINNLQAASRDEILEALDRNEIAIKAAKRLVKKFDATTQWFIALNDYGMIVVIPMTQDSYEFIMLAYKVEASTAYLEKKVYPYHNEENND